MFRMAVSAIALVFLSPASASKWYIDPSVTLGVERHDNIRLSASPQATVSGQSAAASAELGIRAETWAVQTNVSGASTRYDSDSVGDRDDFRLRLQSRLAGERNVWQLGAGRAQDTLLASEKVDADSGLLRPNTKRWTETFSPAWTHSLNATTQLQLNYEQLQSIYNDGQDTNLNDYRSRSVQGAFSKQWSARTTLSLSGANSTYQASATDYESRTESASLGVSHKISEVLDVDFSLGRRRTTSEGQRCVYEPDPLFGIFLICTRLETISTTDNGTVYSLNFDRRFERSQLSANINRSVDPSGTGTEVEADKISAQWTHELRQSRLWFIVGIESARFRSISGDASGIDREYYRIEPRLRYRLTERFEIDSYFRHIRQRYDATDESITSDALYLTLTYRPPRMARSR